MALYAPALRKMYASFTLGRKHLEFLLSFKSLIKEYSIDKHIL